MCPVSRVEAVGSTERGGQARLEPPEAKWVWHSTSLEGRSYTRTEPAVRGTGEMITHVHRTVDVCVHAPLPHRLEQWRQLAEPLESSPDQ